MLFSFLGIGKALRISIGAFKACFKRSRKPIWGIRVRLSREFGVINLRSVGNIKFPSTRDPSSLQIRISDSIDLAIMETSGFLLCVFEWKMVENGEKKVSSIVTSVLQSSLCLLVTSALHNVLATFSMPENFPKSCIYLHALTRTAANVFHLHSQKPNKPFLILTLISTHTPQMADKELTVFLLDASVSCTAYKYAFDTLAGKLLKGLKTDYVTIATFHSATTKHAFADKGKYIGVEILLEFEAVSFSSLRRIYLHLCGAPVLNPNPSPECADIVQTVLFASTLFAPTNRKTFTRNIVVVSDPARSVLGESLEKTSLIPSFFADLNVNFHTILANLELDVAKCNSVAAKIREMFPSGKIFTSKNAETMLERHPPIRKTRPVATYMGEMRFGSDFDKIVGNNYLYNPSRDQTCVSFRVELYPAAKSDTSSLETHEYMVDSDQRVVKLERNTSHFVWERNLKGGKENERTMMEPMGVENPETEKNFDKKHVDTHSLIPAFKFSNFDLLALDDDLLQATKLPLFSGFDIFAFIPVSKIPYELLTSEAYYVVPEKASSIKNTLNFQAFIESLHLRKLAALCRFVQKQEREVEVGAAFPVKVKADIGAANCLVFIRLPYKEDEKIGRFPPLSVLGNPENTDADDAVDAEDAQKAASIALLMDSFVNERTYESDENDEYTHEGNGLNSTIDNFKVTMKYSENSKLALPPDPQRNLETPENPFLRTSPSANRWQAYMRNIVIKALPVELWVSHFEDPDFIANNIRDLAEFTNFFNLRNCLAVNEPDSGKLSANWLLEINEKSIGTSKRLAAELGAKYVRKSETMRAKTGKDTPKFYQRGNYGADEGTYDKIPQFEF